MVEGGTSVEENASEAEDKETDEGGGMREVSDEEVDHSESGEDGSGKVGVGVEGFSGFFGHVVLVYGFIGGCVRVGMLLFEYGLGGW